MHENSLKNLTTIKYSKQRFEQKKSHILQFLVQEKYTSTAIVQELFGLNDRAITRRFLRKMVAHNYLKKYKFSALLTLWGITQNGIHEAQKGQENVDDWSYFEPSKINISTLNHTLNIQRIHALCIRNKIEFLNGKRLGSREHRDKIPDAIITIKNFKVAIEVEHHIKSRRRYDAIVYHYLKCIKARDYDRVLYVMPNNDKCQQVKKAIHSLGKITMTIKGRKTPLTLSQEHLGFFAFISLDDLPSFLARLQSKLDRSCDPD